MGAVGVVRRYMHREIRRAHSIVRRMDMPEQEEHRDLTVCVLVLDVSA